MVRAITFHAIERLSQRRRVEHLWRHLNKVRRWNLPDDGDTVHKGYRYITHGGVLITVIPDKKFMKELKNETTK